VASKQLGERQQLAAQLRWVTRLDQAQQCEGFLARTPLKALYAMGGKPPVGLDNYRCKLPAYWRFTALKKSHARDGVYCWLHLVYRGLYGDTLEEARTHRATAALERRRAVK
jgi:hypothetical protein